MKQEITDRRERAFPRRHERRPTAGPEPSARPPVPPLTYVPFDERPLTRLCRLFTGLALYGFSLSLLLRASLGVNPWSVLYEGLGHHVPLSFGTISAAVGALVLLLWIPLRQRPTFGTFANIAVLATSSDLGLWLVPAHLGLPGRIGLLAGGVLLNGFAMALYVGARFGPGPRDGLMTGTAAVTGRSIRLVRTLIELTVLTAGWLLGGKVGVGTVLYALAVGPVVQFFLPWFAYRADDRPACSPAMRENGEGDRPARPPAAREDGEGGGGRRRAGAPTG